MVERVREVTITIEIDTNKQTIRETFPDMKSAVDWYRDHFGYEDGEELEYAET